jgi:hypothetical protein
MGGNRRQNLICSKTGVLLEEAWFLFWNWDPELQLLV